MLFNSLEYAVLLPLVFVLYWTLFKGRLQLQNIFLLITSYVFYGWWDWRFLILIVASSITDYLVGIALDRTDEKRRRKLLLGISIAVNLGLLGFFKYFNFFIEGAADLIQALGMRANLHTLEIILPIGISFYTFQTLSYTIDVYRRDVKASTDVVAFFTFVAFFPQLIAGPVERAGNLLKQINTERNFDWDMARDGLRQILWGLVKKVVIADTLALTVADVYDFHEYRGSIQLVLGAIYFYMQIYCDFSGYSDIAIGTAKLLGLKLMDNFTYPLFSTTATEFWRRWNISIMNWFRDYIYIPLGGGRVSLPRKVFNVMAVFGISGLWHGADYTYVLWGLVNGLYVVPFALMNAEQRSRFPNAFDGRRFPGLFAFSMMLLIFASQVFVCIIFRAEDIPHLIAFLGDIAGNPLLSPFKWWTEFWHIGCILVLLVWEWIMRDRPHGLAFDKLGTGWRWLIYLLFTFLLLYSFQDAKQFIYFQF